jgi:cytochrome c-type biogenesis protein CcmE
MSRKLLAGTLLLGASILYAVFSLGRPKPVYSRSVSEFLAHPIRDEAVRIQGSLVPGSLVRLDEPCEYRFRLVDRWSPSTDAAPSAARPELSVRYPRCIVPDTFRDTPGFEGAVVTVEGKMCQSCHHFEASEIYAKVTLKYQMKGRAWTDAPKAPVGL